MNILGISAFYHDSAAALIVNDDIVAACQEERFTRVKHDKRFPENAIESVISLAELSFDQIDMVVFYESLEKKFDRIMTKNVSLFPKSFKNFRNFTNKWIFHRSHIKNEMTKFFNKFTTKINWSDRITFSEHHLSHAASAFYPSPFEESAVVIVDGVGEWESTSIYKGSGNKITKLSEIQYPHSLGLLYSAFTEFLGFKVNSGEYKVMGLAPYGEPLFEKLIKDNMVEIFLDGSFCLNLEYFDFLLGKQMITNRFSELFGISSRKPGTDLKQSYANVAASIQAITNEIMLKISLHAMKLANSRNLCLAGGVALNCVSNGLILKREEVQNLWIQPAAGDAGAAIGAALLGANKLKKLKRKHVGKCDAMNGSYLGPQYSNHQIKSSLENLGAVFRIYDEDKFIEEVTDLLIENKTIGWFQGRMEFGPRALGSRSIIGNSMSAEMQSVMNLKIKYRESFRPFAPSVLTEDKEKYFDLQTESPYMLMVADVKEELRLKEKPSADNGLVERFNKKRSIIPAVTHVDYSARIQTVDSTTNPKYHRLINNFKYRTKCSVIINTSFNVRGEPIVCTPEDAFRCFMGTDMDALAIENIILRKNEQRDDLKENYVENYDLD